MSDWTIYHNPHCSKSRQTLQLLQDNGIEPKIIEYLNTPIKQDELKKIIQLLNIEAKDLLRTKESVFKDLELNTNNSHEVIKAMMAHPKLIERPIVIKDQKAVLGRPPENVKELF